jgi:hypothetical protein
MYWWIAILESPQVKFLFNRGMIAASIPIDIQVRVSNGSIIASVHNLEAA